MFHHPTTFVIGAGASHEFDFPLGGQLADSIKQFMHLRSTPMLEGAAAPFIMQARAIIPEPHLIQAAEKIFNAISFSSSIDDFLSQRQDDQAILLLGKMAIVHQILQAETNSTLYQVANRIRSIGDTKFNKTWLFKLVKMLFKDHSPSTAKDVFKNVRFILFNYDRSLELYMASALSSAFSLPIEETQRIVTAAPIHHVYGSVGALPGIGKGATIGFGDDAVHRHDYVDLSKRIRTYAQSYEDAEERKFIDEAVTFSDQLIFLGCGYHKQNIDVLRPKSGLARARFVGTTKGISQTGLLTVTKRLRSLLSEKHQRFTQSEDLLNGLHDLTCSELLDEYALPLTG